MKSNIHTGKPVANGTRIGQTVVTKKRRKIDTFWKWTGTDWTPITKIEYEASVGGSTLFLSLIHI